MNMNRVLHLFIRLRRLALLMLPTIGFALVVSGDGRDWRLWILGAAALIIGALGYGHKPRIERAVASIFVLHTAVITVTGGVESPILPILVPVVVVLAVAAGRGRVFVTSVGILGVVVATLLALRWSGFDTAVPSLFRSGPAPDFDGLYLSLTAAFIVLFMVVGGSIGLLVRSDLDAAAQGVAAARAETLAELTDRNREQAALSSTLAHELKNPLAAIQSLSDLVARKLDPDSREQDQMRVLIGEVHRLGYILDEFLNLSRPVEGLNTVKVAPITLLRGVQQLYEAAASERGIKISVEGIASPSVHCDPRKIRQVLVNLVENAMRATPDASQVRLRAWVVEGGVCFSVHDAGPGLPKIPVDRLFQSGVTTHPDGTGLGLTIAQAIITQHQGRLTLSTHPKGGAIAQLFLPVEAS